MRVVRASDFDEHRRTRNDTMFVGAAHDAALAVAAFEVDLAPERLMDWMTLGGPTLAFLDDGQLLGTLTYLHPGYVRSSLWDGDAPLIDSDAAAEWLRHCLEG